MPPKLKPKTLDVYANPICPYCESIKTVRTQTTCLRVCMGCNKVFKAVPWYYCTKVEPVVPGSAQPQQAPADSAEPDWTKKCTSCGQSPVVPVTGLCGPCSFGDASTAGGNW